MGYGRETRLGVVDEVVSNVRGLSVADMGSRIAEGIITDVRDGESTEGAALWLRRKRLIRATSTKKKGASCILVGNNVHLYCKGHG